MKIYLAGSEAQISSPTYSFRPREDSNLFMSYYYNSFTSNALRVMSEYQPQKTRPGWITIDSGAHTFFGFAGISVSHNDNHGKLGKMPDPIEYHKKYIRWLKENYEKFSYFVELDLQSLFGMDMVWNFRRALRDEGLLDKCIMVHHSCNTQKDLDDLLKFTRSGYLGFEGKMGGTFKLDYKKLLKITYHEGVKVHGFALTSQSVIERWPFYSVDSSSWLGSVRFGVLFNFKQGKMHQIQSRKDQFFKHNVPMELHRLTRTVESSFNKLANNEKAFKDMAKHVTKLWEARGVDYGERFEAPRKYEEFK